MGISFWRDIMSKVIDLTGQRFGRLTVIRKAESRGSNAWWECVCDCGNTHTVRSTELRTGASRSCGCLKGSHLKDLTGQRFGKLTVISRAETKKDRKARWLCRCDCGNETIVIGRSLRVGMTQSCGCKSIERCAAMGKANATHGLSRTRLYRIWNGMVRRCHNPKAQHYEYYGGRGITVCPEWRDSFETFREWALANGYREDLSIDRENNDGPYSPDNCRWATDLEQANNMSSNTIITYNGKAQNLKQWASELGISYTALICRFDRGWSIDKAFSTPTTPQERLVTYNGETHSVTEWAHILGIKPSTLSTRINSYGWSVEKALTTPVQRHRRREG